MAYLKRRGGIWYAQLAIPQDLRPILGTSPKSRSLQTSDHQEAKRRVLDVLAQWRDEFDDLRARRNLTADDKADATWQHYTATLERYEEAQASRPTPAEVEAATDAALAEARKSGAADAGPIAMLNAMTDVEILANKATWEARRRAARLNRLRADLSAGNPALVDSDVNAYLDRNKLLVDPLSPDHGDLARRIMRAEIEALEATLKRDKGDYTYLPADPIVKPATRTTREVAKPGETIMELFDTYAAENPRGITADTLKQGRRDVGLFVDYVGSTCPVHRIDKKAVREWKALLMRYPVKASETKVFAGMSPAHMGRVIPIIAGSWKSSSG